MKTSMTRTLLTAAVAATTLAIGSLAMSGDAMAKGKHGWHGWHGHHNFHRWHGHRWHGRYFYGSYGPGYAGECYFVRKPYGRVIKICPDYY